MVDIYRKMYSKINNKSNCKKLIVSLIFVNTLKNHSFGNKISMFLVSGWKGLAHNSKILNDALTR